MRQGKVWVNKKFAGLLTEDDEGYNFSYQKEYLKSKNSLPVSLTLPLQEESIEDKKNTTVSLRDLSGAWEDSRNSDEINKDIRNSRVEKQDNIDF